jgi:two-component system, NarL family, sensor histidine kinase UhpB
MQATSAQAGAGISEAAVNVEAVRSGDFDRRRSSANSPAENTSAASASNYSLSKLTLKLGGARVFALLLVLAVTANGVLDALQVREVKQRYLGDARQGVLNAEFEFAVGRAVNGIVTYLATGAAQHLVEANKALDSARLALEGHRSTLVNPPIDSGPGGQHIALYSRQRELFSLVQRNLEQLRGQTTKQDAARPKLTLEQIRIFESAAALLHEDVRAHREVEWSANDASYQAATQKSIYGFAASLLLLVTLILANFFLLRRSIVRPIGRLSSAADAVAAGNLDGTVSVTANDEIGTLQRAFNRMVHTLRERHVASRESEEHLREIAMHFPGVYIVTKAQTMELLYVSPGYEQLWSADRSRLFANPLCLAEAVHPEDSANFLAEWTRVDGGASQFEFRIRGIGGVIRWVLQRRIPVTGENGRLLRQIHIFEDITQRKHAEREIREAGELSRRFAATLNASIETERVRIARELHDELGQLFTGLSLDVASLSMQMNEWPGTQQTRRMRARLTAMSAVINDAIGVARRIANDLRPLLLDHLGIVAALEALGAQAAQRGSIRCAAKLDYNIELEPQRATLVYRICQEALTNVARHARASRVEICFRREHPGMLLLEVSDNGTWHERATNLGSLGIIGMRERANLLGGSLTLTRAGGTAVRVRFPAATTMNTEPDAILAG